MGNGIARRRRGSTVTSLTLAFLIAVVGLVVTPAWASAIAVSSPSGGSASTSHATDSLGAASLQAAERSLAEGSGPAYGRPVQCTTGSGGATYRCGTSSVPAAPLPSGRPALATTSPSWSALPYLPTSRIFAMMTFDAADKEVVLFGGGNSTGIVADTWVFTSSGWTELNLSSAPPARYAAQMAYDYKDKYVVLFGGYSASYKLLADTWKFVGNKWTKLAPSTSPPATAYGEMVWDTNNSYLVLFGGQTGASTTGSWATWTFVGGSWTKLSTPTHPDGRILFQMGYDTANGWVILFGGYNSSVGTLGDNWNFSKGHWTQFHPATTPAARYGGVLANDTADGYLVLQGGAGTTTGVASKIWSYANGTWTQLTGANPPPARTYSDAVYDAELKEVVDFGGESWLTGALSNGTWLYHAGTWTNFLGFAPPTAVAATMAYDAADGYVVLFGGATLLKFYGFGTTPTNQTWTFAHDRWTRLKPKHEPPARVLASMVWDAADGYILLYGGEGANGGLLNDTWTFSKGAWTQIFPGTNPGPRFYAQMAYDAADGYVVLFGGIQENSTGANFVVNDTWTFSGGSWSLLIINGCAAPPPACAADPPQLYSGMMTYDAADGVVVLFGGIDSRFVVTNQTWLFSGGVWTNWTVPSNAPPLTYDGSMTYDANDGYVLLYGGYNGIRAENETWSFLGGVWTRENPAVNPGSAAYTSMAYDPTDACVVLVDGFVSYAAQYMATWTY